MHLDSLWAEKFVGRRPNWEVFNEYFSQNGNASSNYICYMGDDFSLILNVYVNLNEEGLVSEIDTYKAKNLYCGHGRPVNEERLLSKRDIKTIVGTLDECLIARYPSEIDEILKMAVTRKIAFAGYSIRKINKNSISFSTESGKIVKLKLGLLYDALELSHVYLEIFDDITFLQQNSDYFGDDNIAMIWAILSVVDPKAYSNYLEILDQYKYRNLLEAVESGDITRCSNYIDVVSMKYAKSYKTRTLPLMAAVQQSNTEICQWLLENGADPNEKDHKRWPYYSPLEFAIQRNDDKMIALLEKIAK